MERASGDLLGLSEEVVLLYGNGEYTQCVSKLRTLQKHLVNTDRWELNPSVLYHICGVIQGEVTKWKHGVGNTTSLDSLNVVLASLRCLKNTFPHCSKNQLLVTESKDLLNPIMSCTQWTFSLEVIEEKKTVVKKLESISEDNTSPSKPEVVNNMQDPTNIGDPEWKEAHSLLALECVMCLGNMVAANTTARKIVWPYLLPLRQQILDYKEWRISQAACMVLHNCLLEEPLRVELLRRKDLSSIVAQLLSLYFNESQYSFFVLLCLESLLSAEGTVLVCWPELSGAQRCLTLDILSTMLTKLNESHLQSLSPSTVTFLTHMFKSEADKILCTHAGQLNQESSQVLARVLSFVCSAAAADTWRPQLQDDTSLLVTSVYLLRCMADIGKEGDNAFTPLSRLSDLHDEEQMVSAASHPTFGFKCDLIRLIASLVYRHRPNQDKVRDIDGVLLLLESSQFDARNILIKEASIFALRNLLEGNTENQELIKSLTLQGVGDNPSLRGAGHGGSDGGGEGQANTKDSSHNRKTRGFVIFIMSITFPVAVNSRSQNYQDDDGGAAYIRNPIYLNETGKNYPGSTRLASI